MNGVFSFFIGFLSIALMVTIHETGHFLFARMLGITVETFAIGWGRAIKRWHTHGIEYRINIFPLGGYCTLKGSEDLRRSLARGEQQMVTIEEGSLFAVPPHRRILAFLAGPLFNLMFAVLLFIPFFVLDHEEPVFPNRIVLTSDYPRTFGTESREPHAARDGGLLTGDSILMINGESVEDFAQVQEKLHEQKNGLTTRFTVSRDGRELDFNIQGIYHQPSGRQLFGISYFLEPVIATVAELSPESVAGLMAGDRITEAQGIRIENTMDVIEALSDNPSTVSLVVDRSGLNVPIRFSPTRSEDGSMTLSFTFLRQTVKRRGQSMFQGITSAVKETSSVLIGTFTLIPRLIGGTFAVDEVVAGPLRISYVIGEMRNSGIRALLHLMAMVSVSLAAANLLPIPGLDGGSILLSLIEILRGKPVSPRMYVRFQSVGIVFLLFLMVLVVAGDLRFLFLGS